MRGRFMFALGLGAGYVLGARAGRSRYEQIKHRADAVWHDPRVQEKVDQASAKVAETAPQVPAKLAQAAVSAGSAVKDKAPDVAAKVADAASSVKDAAGSVKDAAGNVKDTVKDKVTPSGPSQPTTTAASDVKVSTHKDGSVTLASSDGRDDLLVGTEPPPASPGS